MTTDPSILLPHDRGRQELLRTELLAAEQHTGLRLSPDGRSVAYVKTLDEGQELWLRDADGCGVLASRHHGESVTDVTWTPDGTVLLFRHSPRGREQWKLTGIRVSDLTVVSVPAPGPVTELWTGPEHPSAVAYSVRNASTRTPELYRTDFAAPGAGAQLLAADTTFHRWLVDRTLTVRGGIQVLRDGSVRIVMGHRPDPVRPLMTIAVDDSGDLSVQGFSPDGTSLYVLSGSRAPTRSLLAVDCATGEVTALFSHHALDVESYPIAGQGVWFDPVTGLPDLCAVMGQRLSYHPLTDRASAAVERLTTGGRDTHVVMDRSADDRTWLTVRVHDDGPIVYQLFRPDTGSRETVFANRPGLVGHPMPGLADFRFTAADGLELTGYLMQPLQDGPPPPAVVLVHGGPSGRDYWRFHAEAQYLASLGYASLHINYRGSRGFGRAFRLAGNGQWGARMQQDLYDAVAAAGARGLIDPGRVAFLGGSYGGYSALLAAVTRPDLVRCAVAISPLCDLVSLAATPPAYWQTLATMLRRQILGSQEGPTEADLRRRSPAHALDGSCAPTLVAHGVRDPRVPVADVDHFVARAEELGVPMRYLRFPDEGHHVVSNRNRHLLFGAVTEFLEAHLADRDSDTAPLHAR
jgi:dipeptidyl aminopeptidase/acylaminoacyl peptidase